jgi:hypothetical protein
MVIEETQLVDTLLDLLDRAGPDVPAGADLVHLRRLGDHPLVRQP